MLDYGSGWEKPLGIQNLMSCCGSLEVKIPERNTDDGSLDCDVSEGCRRVPLRFYQCRLNGILNYE